jgi:hypothetical protein
MRDRYLGMPGQLSRKLRWLSVAQSTGRPIVIFIFLSAFCHSTSVDKPQEPVLAQLACFGNPDPVDMKVYCPEGEETFNDDETTEEAPT